MTEFETQNTVDVVIDDRSLTEARADLEGALSEVPVDVAVKASGDGGGGQVAARDRARSRQLLTEQTESIDELREELTESGGGQWQQQFALSRERNRILREIAEGIDEGNFDRAARSGGGLVGGGAALLGGGALLGVGALSSVLSSFSWPSLPEFTWPDLPALEPPGPPPEPDWHPLTVTEPDPVPVADPREQPVEDPKEQPVEDPKTQPVEEPQPVPTPEPDWLPIEIGMPELSTSGATEAGGDQGLGKLLLGGLAGVTGLEAIRKFGASTASKAGSSASGGAFLTPEGVGVTDPGPMNRRRQAFNQRTPDFLDLPRIPEDKYSGSVFSADGRQAQADGIRGLVSQIESVISDLRESVRSTQDETSSTRRTDVNVETNISVDGATRREVERAAEQAKKESLREFERRINGGRGR